MQVIAKDEDFCQEMGVGAAEDDDVGAVGAQNESE